MYSVGIAGLRFIYNLYTTDQFAKQVNRESI